VYYIFLYPPRDFRWLVTAQLEHLCRTQILFNSTLHVSISTTGVDSYDHEAHYRLKNATNLVEELVYDCFKTNHKVEQPSYSIEISISNSFEYPGISLVYDLSHQTEENERNDTVVLYLHSKGMVYHPDDHKRCDEDLFKVVIEPWRTALAHFEKDPGLNKAGFASSTIGSIWHNFFFVRASLAARLVRPIIVREDRYWYEHWLSKIENDAVLIHNQNVRQRLDFLPNPIRPSNGMSSCADSWSMCLPTYHRGISIAPEILDKCTSMIDERLADTWWKRNITHDCGGLLVLALMAS